MPDAGAPAERSPTEGDSMSSSSHIQRSNTIKKHKVAPSIGSRRSRYTSAETVMSMSEGECRLVPLPRRQLKFQSPHISRQIEQYMRTDFFGSSFVIPLWRTSQGNISDRVEDRKARVISLGDVGYFDKDAGFCVLFNVYKTFEENLSIGYDPPTCFRHYVPPPGKAISSTLIMRGEEYQPLHGDFKESDWFSDKRDYFLACETPLSKDSMQATALALPDGCIRHHTLVSALATMQDYFNEQAMGWYDYYSSDVHKKDGLVKGSLKLITACYISRTYGAAVFVKEPSKRAEQAFAALCRQRKDEDVYSWERKGAVRTKSGPVPAELVNNKAAYESLCVAVEVTAIKVGINSKTLYTLMPIKRNAEPARKLEEWNRDEIHESKVCLLMRLLSFGYCQYPIYSSLRDNAHTQYPSFLSPIIYHWSPSDLSIQVNLQSFAENMSRVTGLQMLPPELHDKIIDYFKDDLLFLRSCASACRVFIARCQYYMFRSLALATDPNHRETKHPGAELVFLDANRFYSIIKDSPHIADYVRHLRIASVPEYGALPEGHLTREERAGRREREKSVAFCLDRLRNLRCLSIDSGKRCPVFKNPILLRAIQAAIVQPTLVCLDQSSMLHATFRQKAHLTCLSFTIDANRFPPSSARGASQVFDLPRCSVEFLRVRQVAMSARNHHMDNFLQRAIDITNLKCLYIVSETCQHYATGVEDLFQACGKKLQRLIFEYEWLGASRSWNVRHFEFSLEKLHALRVLEVRLSGEDVTFILNSFVRLLASLPTANKSRFKELSIQVNYSRIQAEAHVIGDWNNVWNVATNQDNFPRLEKLELKGYFSPLNELHTPDNVLEWRNHFTDVFQRPRPEKLKVIVEIVKFDNAFDDASEFWPEPGFEELVRLR
ncbi:hypothetical protein D9613_002461 [Agrocybe pediades]|uniref:Uncharacterized protein n=1 Tax=Agrocybe pediades TaxID=84607 RepID=A0A8H4QQC1_9AGAR|nr:hypothetical protein D9613_002461 [Agrocybe pediades]